MKPAIHPFGAFGALYEAGAGYEGRKDNKGRLYLEQVKVKQAPPTPTKAQEFRINEGGARLVPIEHGRGFMGPLKTSEADRCRNEAIKRGSI